MKRNKEIKEVEDADNHIVNVECNTCGHEFEWLQPYPLQLPPNCPVCGSFRTWYGFDEFIAMRKSLGLGSEVNDVPIPEIGELPVLMDTKNKNFDVFDNTNTKAVEELKKFREYNKNGRVKPLNYWGCVLCCDRKGVSDYAIYNVSLPKSDMTFCSRHGFLAVNHTFRRIRARTQFKRELMSADTHRFYKEAREAIANLFGVPPQMVVEAQKVI